MKNKIIIAIASIILNLALFAALIHTNSLNDRPYSAPPLAFHIHHLPNAVFPQD